MAAKTSGLSSPGRAAVSYTARRTSAHQANRAGPQREWHAFGMLGPELSAQANRKPGPGRSRTSEVLRGPRSLRLTASDRSWRRIAAPILLPESDTAHRVVAAIGV